MKNIIITLLVLLTCHSSLAAREKIETQAAPKPIGVYSQAIKMGNTVYISGQIPIDPKTGNIVQGSFKDHVRQAFNNVKVIANAAGGTSDNIGKITVYVTDLNNFALVNEVMLEFFHPPYPARSVIEIKSLPKGASVEIEAVMQLEKAESIRIQKQ